jgi:hypothetical protein
MTAIDDFGSLRDPRDTFGGETDCTPPAPAEWSDEWLLVRAAKAQAIIDSIPMPLRESIRFASATLPAQPAAGKKRVSAPAFGIDHHVTGLPNAAPVDERQAFEKWLRTESAVRYDETEPAWEAWQARAALATVDTSRSKRLTDAGFTRRPAGKTVGGLMPDE